MKFSNAFCPNILRSIITKAAIKLMPKFTINMVIMRFALLGIFLTISSKTNSLAITTVAATDVK